MTVTEKVSYLKGLAEGLGIDENEKNGKVIKAIIDVLDDLAFTVADLEDGFDELIEQVMQKPITEMQELYNTREIEK